MCHNSPNEFAERDMQPLYKLFFKIIQFFQNLIAEMDTNISLVFNYSVFNHSQQIYIENNKQIYPQYRTDHKKNI